MIKKPEISVKKEFLPGKKRTRIYYGSLRTWDEDGLLLGRAHLNILDRKKLVVNLNVELFTTGKFPYFNKKYKLTECTVNIPIPLLMDVAKEILRKGKRIRKNGDHTWIKRKYKGG